jgi:PAS domain S-box-containing protein
VTVGSDDGKMAEEQLRSAAQLQATLNVIPAHAWYTAPSGGLTFVNKRTADYLGLPKDHPLRLGVDIGAPWDAHVSLLHPDDQEESRKAWSACLRTGEAAEVSQRVRDPQGGYRWFISRAEPLRASDGTLLLWVGVNLDIEELKCAEQALRESEYRLLQIIETVPGLVWSNGPDGEPTHINQRMLDFSGMRFEDFKHRGWEGFVHPADYPETARAFDDAIQTGTSYEGVMRLRRADGEFRWHHARCEPLRDREGRVLQWYGLSVDIDERKKAEDRLRRSEAYLAEAQMLSHTGTWVLNATTSQCVYWSDEMNRIWGLDPLPGVLSRETVWQRIHPDDRDRVWEEVQKALHQKKDYSGEFRIVLPNGTVKYLTATSRHLFSTNGELVEVIGTNVDVTERKRAEEALRESEGRFRDYAETASDWFWEIGPDYKFTLLTENAFGSHSADRIGAACWDHALDLETEPEKWRLVRAALDARRPFRDFVYYGLDGNDTPMYVKASGKPMFDGDGEFRGYRGTGTDVTAATKAEEALRESEDQLRSTQARLARASQIATIAELSASIAHEVNQPLAAIVASAQTCQTWLSAGGPNIARAKIAVDRIIRDATAAADVVGRIRALFKKVAPDKALLQTNEVIKEVWRLLQSEMNRRGVVVELDLAEHLLPTAADRIQVQQVLMNLIRNGAEAAEASDGPGRLIVRSRHVEGRIIVEVCDSGAGIADKEKVFEPFYSTKPNGMGMGLAISRSIIRAHEGELWARDNVPRGTIFTFTLPTS